MRKAKNSKITGGRETFWQYVERKTAHKRALGHQNTANNYISFSKSLSRFYGEASRSLYPEDIDEKLVMDYELYLKRTGLNLSTVSFYNRIFRSLYNQAVQDGIIKNAHPFDDAYTKVVAVRKSPMVTTTEGDVPLDSLSKEDVIRRYTLLSEKYNSLVDRISGLMKAMS